jgi:predicted  nucleic acid-binding Zn-ribbon protein
VSSHADLRGFRYALEPLLRKRQWELDGLQAKIEQAAKALERARHEHALLEEEWLQYAQDIRQARSKDVDPHGYMLALRHLTQRRAAADLAEQNVKQLADTKQRLSDEWKEQHMKLDLTKKHKTERLGEYVRVEQNRADSELDREWIARREVVHRDDRYSLYTDEENAQ